MFYIDRSVVLQSTLSYTLISSASTGLIIEGVAPLLDHVSITECGNVGIEYKSRGWGVLTMMECNVSHNSAGQLSVHSSADAVNLHRCVIYALL